jgi:hypothetical protein
MIFIRRLELGSWRSVFECGKTRRGFHAYASCLRKATPLFLGGCTGDSR